MAIWPESRKVFKILDDRQSGISINFTNRLILAKPNDLMSIKNGQAIVKCFMDLKSSIWFTLGSEEETMFCGT